jgi:glycerol-3-phosphate dehydrogenase subunit C
MDPSDPRELKSPQQILRSVVDLCADCDTCRPLMDKDCLFFPELYRLRDQEKESGVPLTEAELRSLMVLCTLCGLCPCPRIPADVLEAKSRYIDEEGLPLVTRFLNDIPRLARLCSAFPHVANALQSSKAIGPLLRKVTHVHPDRQFPSFPEENFFHWAESKGLTGRREGSRTVTYFAGCSAGYLFPRIGRAMVEILERNGMTVHVPPQDCCGMPHLLEGDRQTTLERTTYNIGHLQEAHQAGDDLVCSCPSCGYYMKILLKERAYYSEAYQRSVGAGEDELRVPREDKKLWVLKKSLFRGILKDDGYFSSLDPMARIGVAEHLFDAGEYLARLHAEGRFDTRFAHLPERMVYFAPCHQREQKMGRPYLDLLALIPGITVEPVGGDLDCCGMGGNFGFKIEFHEKSLFVGQPLMAKIRGKSPQAIITDCMSCRLQFNHELPYPVFHPLEILARAYQGRKNGDREMGIGVTD